MCVKVIRCLASKAHPSVCVQTSTNIHTFPIPAPPVCLDNHSWIHSWNKFRSENTYQVWDKSKSDRILSPPAATPSTDWCMGTTLHAEKTSHVPQTACIPRKQKWYSLFPYLGEIVPFLWITRQQSEGMSSYLPEVGRLGGSQVELFLHRLSPRKE